LFTREQVRYRYIPLSMMPMRRIGPSDRRERERARAAVVKADPDTNKLERRRRQPEHTKDNRENTCAHSRVILAGALPRRATAPPTDRENDVTDDVSLQLTRTDRRHCLAMLAGLLAAAATPTRAGPRKLPFAKWVGSFRTKALARGISEATYDRVMEA